jgi:hypothetical protein
MVAGAAHGSGPNVPLPTCPQVAAAGQLRTAMNLSTTAATLLLERKVPLHILGCNLQLRSDLLEMRSQEWSLSSSLPLGT